MITYHPKSSPQLDMDLLRDYNFNELTDIPQLDGVCDSSSEAGDDQEEEREDRGPVGENEFLGMINSEALQELQGVGGSSDGNSSSGSDGDEPELEDEEEEVRNKQLNQTDEKIKAVGDFNSHVNLIMKVIVIYVISVIRQLTFLSLTEEFFSH